MDLAIIMKAKAIDENIDKLDFIEIENFCALNDIIKKVKDNILTNHI